MRILKPNKSSGSDKIIVSESGDLSFEDNKKIAAVAATKALDRRPEKAKKRTGRHQASAVATTPSSSQQDNLTGKPEDPAKKECLRLYNKGIYLLSMREHSVKEIETKLTAKCERPDLVPTVVDELIEKKYLSNQRFTESYVRSRKMRGFGPTKISSELSSKGIKNSMIGEYLDAHSAVWYDNAQNEYQKKYGDEAISDYNTWTKRARFMQSRGFTMEHIHSTLPQVDSD